MVDFGCPSCGKQFQVPDAWAGKKSNCLQCGAPLLVPLTTQPEGDAADAPTQAEDQPSGASITGATSPAPDAGEVGTATVIPCPYCAEPIMANAQKCKHCGEWLKPQPGKLANSSKTEFSKGADRTLGCIVAAALVIILLLVVVFGVIPSCAGAMY